MSETCYTHLHVHSCYSLLEAACGPDKLVEKAIAQGCKALALTDTNSCSGLYEFNDLCLKKGIKPILGIELNVSENMKSADDEGPDKRIILLAKNKIGWKNLCILSSESCTTGLVSRPRIDYNLLKTYCEGLIMLTGGMEGHLANCIMYRRYELAEKLLMFCKKLFKDDLYIEVMFHPASHNPASESIERQVYEKSLELGKKFGIKCVCTNDVKYCEQLQSGVQDILYSIKQHKVVKDDSRKSLASSEYFMKTREELEDIFPGQPELFDVTSEIVDKIETKLIEKGRSLLPIYEPPNGQTPVEFLRSIVYDGLKKKSLFDIPEYKERADYEIRVFEACGFVNYFLVLYDFVSWSKTVGIAGGPGRGSAAGSICLYCMDVTKLDPIKYELLFERFFSVDTKYVVDNKSFGVNMTIKDEKFTDEMQEKMFRTCQAHPEFNDQRYFAEEKKMRAMACFENIVKLFISFIDQDGSIGKINECNSIIAFYSGITECRPSGEFKPREELAAARISPPDVDLDFDIYRRDEVFGYLRQKYGSNRTAQIGTSSYFMGKMVIKDVGKTLDIMNDFQRAQEIKNEIKDRRLRNESVEGLDKPRETLDAIDALSAFAETGKTFAEAYAESAELRDAIKQDEAYYYACTQVDGLVRHHGIHAAGIVISKQDVREIIPLKNSKGVICTQFDKDQVEKIGLYKYDLLGVANVSVVDRTIKLIQENRGEAIDLDAIEPNDPAVFQMLNDGYTKGIFQFESKMATDLIQLIKLDNFNDLVACNAINRPGPLKAGVGDSYARRKHGQEETIYPCPQMESVLSKTYGLIVYQEQIMNLSRVMASFTKSEADSLRKACITLDSEFISRARGPITLRRMISEGYKSDYFARMGSDGKQEWGKISDIWKTSKKCVRRTKTRSGYYIDATCLHQILTDTGWKAQQRIANSDRIVCARKLEWDGKNSISRNFAIVMAGLLTEGYTPEGKKYASFVSNNVEFMNVFVEAFEDEFGNDGGKISPDGRVYAIRKSGCEKIFEILGRGLSAVKFIPNVMMSATLEITKDFLSFMLGAEGGVTVNNGSFEYSSKSQKMIRQVRMLLLRFGIRSVLSFKDDPEYGRFYRLYVNDIVEQKKLVSLTDLWPDHKRRDLCKIIEKKKCANFTTDTIPQCIVEKMLNQYPWVGNGESGTLYTSPISRERFHRNAKKTGDNDWISIAESDFWFDEYVDSDEVVSKSMDVYDFTVKEGSPNMIVNGIVIHNCGKKDKQLMEQMRQKFVDGCMTNDIEKAIAVEVWQMIEYFGEYGFNLSHSAAYGMLSYYTAFLKRYYPLEYFCALLSSCEDKCDTYEYLCEAKRIGVQCWPVNVNRSGNKYVIEKGGLRLPLSIVDGVGENALKAIIAARPYSSFEEFVKNVDTRVVNTTVIRNLTVIKTTIKNKYGKEFVVELSTGAFAPFSITDPELAQKKFELLKNDMKKQRVSHSRFSSENLFEDSPVVLKV